VCYLNDIFCLLQSYGTDLKGINCKKTRLPEEIYIFVFIFSKKSVVEYYTGWLNDLRNEN
jgi:hypothetical protein